MRAVLCLVAVLALGVAARGDSPFYARRTYHTFGDHYAYVVGHAATYWTATNEIELMTWLHEFEMPTPPLPANNLHPFYFALYHTTPDLAPIADFDSVDDVPWMDARASVIGPLSQTGGTLNCAVAFLEFTSDGFDSRDDPIAFPIQYTITESSEFAHQLRPRQMQLLERRGISPTTVWSARFSFDELNFSTFQLTAFRRAWISAFGDDTVAQLVGVDRVRADVIPEPSTIALASLGVVALLVHRHYRLRSPSRRAIRAS